MTVDAPYGISLRPLWRQEAGLGTAVQTGEITNDDRVDRGQAYALFPGDVAYVGTREFTRVRLRLEFRTRFENRTQIIWTKPHFVLSRGDYHGHMSRRSSASAKAPARTGAAIENNYDSLRGDDSTS